MLQISTAPVRSILILQTKFIGDLVLASALARNLQLGYPGVGIVFLCEARFASFLTAHGIATDVVTFRRAMMRGSPLQRGRELYSMVRRLRRFRFDMTIDLTDSKTSRIVSGLVNAPIRVGYHPSEGPCAGTSVSRPTYGPGRSASGNDTISTAIFHRSSRLASICA